MKTTTIQEIVDYLYRCDEDFNYVAFMYLLENANNLSLETKAEIRVSIDGKAYPEKVSLREAIEINRKADAFFAAGFTKFTDQIKFQSRMTFAESGIVIGISPVAAGVTGEKIHTAIHQLSCEFFSIKLFTD